MTFSVTRLFKSQEGEWEEETNLAESWGLAVASSQGALQSILADFDINRVTIQKNLTQNAFGCTIVWDAENNLAGVVTIAPVAEW
jgi:hypothetical protein